MDDALLAVARGMDAARAERLLRELAPGPGLAAAVLVGTAFPPLLPVDGWRREAVERLVAEGWRSPHSRSDALQRLLAATGDLGAPERALPALRRAVWAEKARIALRELLPLSLGGADVETTSAELSDLADAALEVALAEARQHVASRLGPPLTRQGAPARLVVVGLGKLGGRELNAGSDVDLLFVHDTDHGSGASSLVDHWTRVARRLVATLEELTPEGMIWRVDLRLRPEGSQGPITLSLPAVERYYETFGRRWERAALLRARPVAGDASLGEELMQEVVGPFVYRREVDPEIATSLGELVLRSRAELCTDETRDLKLGPGGIREAEFFVQALQLIWGGREKALRVRGTLPALDRLLSLGLVSHREAEQVREAWVLLRRLEHRVQWSTGVQTHLLPEDAEDRARLARSLGYADESTLASDLARRRDAVSELFRGLAPEAPRPPPAHAALLALLDLPAGDPGLAELSALAERVFGSAEVAEHLRALARRPDGLLGALTRERHPALGDQVVAAIAESPDPEQAARWLRSFLGRFRDAGPYVAELSADVRALRRLTSVLGASAFVGEAVVARPELVELLLGEAADDAPEEAVAGELEAAVPPSRPDEPAARREQVVAALRRAKQRVMVQVAVADLAGRIDTREATRRLSALADAVLHAAVSHELGGDPTGLAVIAMGKLGGRELGYGSDLDVLFLYDGDLFPEDAGDRFVRHGQRILRMLGEPSPAGPGYELDARLRPSGTQGLLVTSLRAFARYHGVRLAEAADGAPASRALAAAAPWERQALLRARFSAGDRTLGRRALAVAEEAAYLRGAPPVEELHRLRTRMERELGRERPGRHDLKVGHGGLVDVEFLVQWLQMTHGADRRIRTPDTGRALDALATLGYLGRREYETLREGYTFLRKLEQRIHVLNGTSSTVLDEAAPGLGRLARRLGLSDHGGVAARDALIGRYLDVTRQVRATYLSVLGLAA